MKQTLVLELAVFQFGFCIQQGFIYNLFHLFEFLLRLDNFTHLLDGFQDGVFILGKANALFFSVAQLYVFHFFLELPQTYYKLLSTFQAQIVGFFQSLLQQLPRLMVFEPFRQFLLRVLHISETIFGQKLSYNFHQLKIRFLYIRSCLVFLRHDFSVELLFILDVKGMNLLYCFMLLLNGWNKRQRGYVFDLFDQVLESLEGINDD